MTNKIKLNLSEDNCCEGNCGCGEQKPLKPLMKDINEDCGCAKEDKGCGCGHTINQLVIDFLFLDLTQCTRCQNTESTLETSLEEIKAVLQSADYEVILNKIHINSLEEAIKYEFESSPTIRVNGKDVISKTLESSCQDCGDLCGGEVDCRDWEFQGERYTEPPKAMLMNAIFKAIYVPETIPERNIPYVVPNNIIHFFEQLNNRNK